MTRVISLAAFTLLSSLSVQAADTPASQSPYIDSLKQNLGGNDTSSESYTEKLKQKLATPESDSTGYTEKLKRELPPDPSQGYAEKQRQELPAGDGGGAIQALNEGRSELHAKYEGKIKGAFGFKVGELQRSVTAPAGVQLQNFGNVYGDTQNNGNYNSPVELGFFYEFQPFHSETWGNFGIMTELSLSYFHGFGTYKAALTTPTSVSGSSVINGGQPIGQQSLSKLQFFTVPITAGIDYRFNLAKYIRPYAFVGPSAILYDELRYDGQNGNKGYSFALQSELGVSILLDWISSQSRWDIYDSSGVKHFYLTIAYQNLSTFNGDVSIGQNGVYGGLTFEY